MEENNEIICFSESKPLKSLEELLGWSERPEECVHTIGCQPLKSYPLCRLQTNTKPNKRMKTLVCHDMKGGYLDDRFNDGCDNESAYRFFHWSSVDIFVYFSHNLVTIPPISWINASHKNRVPILGTFIVEGWAQTSLICTQILESNETIERVVSKLVEISKFYRFEGWLINIESQIDPNLIQSLIYFVQLLTECMHSYDPHSLVIWYDSVISPSGALKWQNELNLSNKCFFDICDGIFLNYTWNDINLENSYKMSRNISRNYDVFVGIDVFGRNCFGGGGLNTHLAVKEIRKYELSIAIFANGWTHEVLGEDNFTDNEYKFWSTLSPYLGSDRCPQTLPICTSFCQGFGHKRYKSGQICSEQKWHNLSAQELQPTSHQSIEIHLSDAFNGGGSLRLKNHWVPLFQCQVIIDRCFYAITYKPKSDQKLTTILKYKTNNGNKTLNLCENDINSKDFNIKNIKSDNDFKQDLNKFNEFGVFEARNGWLTQAFIIEREDIKLECILESIELSVCEGTEDRAPDVLIGQLVCLDTRFEIISKLFNNYVFQQIFDKI